MRNNQHYITRFFSAIINTITTAFTALFGKISWQSPTWLSFITQKYVYLYRTNKKGVISVFITLLTLIVTIAGAYSWYQKQPKPIQITASITTPSITPLDTTLNPVPLIIDFGTNVDGAFTASSVAPLSNIGKTVANGIELDPDMPGQWQWKTDSELVFTPKQDWPAGQNYQVNFDKAVFTTHLNMASYHYSFATLTFAINIDALKFDQDLNNPQQARIVGTIDFNFPVDDQSFEQHTYLKMMQLKNDQVDLAAQRYPITFTYDKFKRTAYIRSDLINLPTVPRHVNLVIEPGVQPATGISQIKTAVTQDVLIPDVGSFLHAQNVDATIARDENDNPRQLLIIETSLGVSNAELASHLHVYLLPKDMPATATQDAQQDYQWQEPGEVTDTILNQSQLLNITALPEDHPFPTLHSWQFSAPTPRFLYINIDAGVHGFGGFTLTKPYKTIVAVPEMPQEIDFLHKGSLMSLSDEKKLTVVIRGVPLVKFSFARVFPNEINHLVSQTSGDFDNPTFINDSFTSNDISQIFSEKRAFNVDNAQDVQYTTLDLSQYLTAQNGQASPLGLFLIKAQGWDDSNNTATDVENDRLILITDMGILVKNNDDNTHDVFVQSISQGTPVANAKVSILGRNGLAIVSGITGNDGHVLLPSVNDFSNDQEPIVYLVQNGNDTSFMPFDRDDRLLNYSRYDVGGVADDDLNQYHLAAFLFSDRGIYRPGDTIHFGIIVKQRYAQAQPAGLPLEETITDPQGNTVLDQKVNLSDSGLMTLDYKPDATAPTGLYTANIYLTKNGQQDSLLGSTDVRVEEFLPDRLKMQTQLISGNASTATTAPAWLSPDNLTAKVNLWNLFGTPAANRRVSAKLILAPRDLHFTQYPDDIFVDPLLNPNQPPKTFTEDLSDAQTNNQGEAQFDLNLQRFAQATYQLTFFAQGFEAQGGRAVSSQTSALVTPLNYLVGYKPDGNLDYLKQNSAHTVNFIAINPMLKQIDLSDLQTQLITVQTVSTLVKNPDGTYAYQSLPTEQAAPQHPFAIAANGSDFTLPTNTIGNFAVQLSDKQGHTLSKFYYSVVGESGQPIEKNAELMVKLDKPLYKAGDTIQMQITAPYTGAGIITIERDKVYAYQWFKTNSTNSVQSIQIPPNFQGDGYVNVAFVRDWNSNEIYMSPLSYSVVPFSISHDDQTVHIHLSASKLVQPGDQLTIQYSSDKPSKIILFAADQGILQVANYQTPDPLAYFFQKYALMVNTAQIVDQILPRYISARELSAVGGDGEEKELASNLNPFKRKTEAPVAYWSGILDSDATPRSVTYTIPNYFNGDLHIMSVAVAPNAVGNADQDTLVHGDFVISPNVPTVVAPGDKFIVSASIANNIKGSGVNTPTTISLTTSNGLTISGNAQQQIIIPEGQQNDVQFALQATQQLGNATLTFQAHQGNKSGQINTTVSVRPANPNQTTLISGSDDSTSKSIDISRQLYPEFSVMQASASTNPLILAGGLQGYLDNYPYYCTEQLISTAFAQLAIAKQPLFNADPAVVAKKMDATLQMLRQRLNSDGGFSYWPGSTDPATNDFSTVYAVDYLTEAKLQGYPIPDDLLQSGLTYLKNMVAADVSSLDQARLDAYAIYLLTRNEIVTTDYLTPLQTYLMQQSDNQWQQDITSVYLASTYHLLKNDDEANKLIKGYSLQNPVKNPSDFNNNLTNNAQYIMLLARYFPDRLQQLGDVPIMAIAQGINSDEFDTLAAAYSANALSAYAQMNSSPDSTGLSLSEKLADGTMKDLPSINTQYLLANFDAPAQQIQINNPNKLHYFYQIRQTGFNLSNANSTQNNGLEVFREYRDNNQNVIQQTALGSDIESHIQIRSLNNQTINNVAIVDLLPGGFEIVPNSISASDCGYEDVREDRVVFYCSVSPTAEELSYHLRAVNKGSYTVPPIFAQSMYNQTIQSVGKAGQITVQ